MIYFSLFIVIVVIGLLYRIYVVEEERDHLESYWRTAFEYSDDLNEALMEAIRNAGFYPEEYAELKIVLKKINERQIKVSRVNRGVSEKNR